MCSDMFFIVKSLPAREIYIAYLVTAGHVSTFLESLYEQKHAFYFRKVREWHEFHQVNFCIYGSHIV